MPDVRFLVADASPSVQKFFQQLIVGYGFEADSIKTASTYRARVLQKMNMESNQDMTRYALVHGLIV